MVHTCTCLQSRLAVTYLPLLTLNRTCTTKCWLDTHCHNQLLAARLWSASNVSMSARSCCICWYSSSWHFVSAACFKVVRRCMRAEARFCAVPSPVLTISTCSRHSCKDALAYTWKAAKSFCQLLPCRPRICFSRASLALTWNPMVLHHPTYMPFKMLMHTCLLTVTGKCSTFQTIGLTELRDAEQWGSDRTSWCTFGDGSMLLELPFEGSCENYCTTQADYMTRSD